MRDYMRTYYKKPAVRKAQIARASARYYSTTRTGIQEANQKRKTEVLTHYGPKGQLRCCASQCEITDIDMLTLDHVANDGAQHRKKITTSVYQWVQRKKYPEGFQTLCANHQLKKELIRRRG